MIVYDKLWDYMEKHNISQYKLIQSGISHSTLTRLKRNQSVSVDTLDKICNLLNCDVSDILQYINER